MNTEYIKQVVVGLDFLSPIEVHERLDVECINTIGKLFKKAQPKSNVAMINISSGFEINANNKPISETQWSFISNDGDKFTLSTKRVVLEIKKYNSYNKSIELKIQDILNKIFEIYNPQLRRVGMRVIVRLDEKNSKIERDLQSYNNLWKEYNISNVATTNVLRKTTEENDEITFVVTHGLLKEDITNSGERFNIDVDGSTSDTVYNAGEALRILKIINKEICAIHSICINA